MAAQDVTEFSARVRRAIYGPTPPATGALTDDALEAMAADALADIILFTNGQWGHQLVVAARDATTNVPTHWQIDPGLTPEEETVVAAQAALTFFFHEFKDKKVSESIVQDGRQWDWSISASVLKDQMAMLREQRDRALTALAAAHPVLTRYASLLEVRDRLASAQLEPWTRNGGLGGGQEIIFIG